MLNSLVFQSHSEQCSGHSHGQLGSVRLIVLVQEVTACLDTGLSGGYNIMCAEGWEVAGVKGSNRSSRRLQMLLLQDLCDMFSFQSWYIYIYFYSL